MDFRVCFFGAWASGFVVLEGKTNTIKPNKTME